MGAEHGGCRSRRSHPGRSGIVGRRVGVPRRHVEQPAATRGRGSRSAGDRNRHVDGAVRCPSSNSPTRCVSTSPCCSTSWVSCTPAPPSTGSRCRGSEAPDVVHSQLGRHAHPLPGHRSSGSAADPVHPGSRRRQERLESATARHGTVVPGGCTGQPGGRSQRQAPRYVRPRADGRRCRRRARPCGGGDRPCGRCIDGRGDQPDRRREVPRTDSIADAGVYRRPQSSVAGELLTSWRDAASERGIGSMGPKRLVG